MKVEYRLFALMLVFSVVMGVIYWIVTGGDEPVGVVALLLTGGMCGMIAGYIAVTARKLDARPDDDPEGNIDAVAGDYGFFAPHSWWPLALALSCALLFLGAAVGWWLVILAFPTVGVATVGWTFEFFRGENAV